MVDQTILKELLDYDKNTGIFTWLKTRSPRAKAGDVAGNLRPDGYIRIGVKGSLYMAHRLAWLYVYGEWPSKEIDHINRVKSDNRIDNLKNCSSRENSLNRSSSNVTGLTGVTQVGKRFSSRIRVEGKKLHLGMFDTAEQAHEAYLNEAKKKVI